MNKANLNFNQLKEYVILLTERDLIYYEKETQSFKTTEKGLRFLQIYSEINDMTKSHH
ncbi:MAG: winged helix-turn-helix domain-containing protein [Nitrososphaera sp.]